MKENWDRAIAHVLLWEGGAAIRANEPGGAVNRGISLQAYRLVHPGASIPDLLAMTEAEAKSIYRDNYADAIEFDKILPGYDAAMLHAAVMFGVHGAMKFDEKANLDLGYLVVLMMQNKMHRVDGCKFMPGWSDRFVAIYELGKELIASSPPKN